MRRFYFQRSSGRLLFALLIISMLLVTGGCGGKAASPTPSLTPTDTLIPTSTPRPTATLTPTITPTPPPAANQVDFPVRAIVYRPWTTADWANVTLQPESGPYDSSDPKILAKQITEMQSAGIQVGLLPWNGEESDAQLEAIFAASQDSGFLWALLDETEKNGDPASGQITLDLQHIQKTFGDLPNYLQVDRRPVVFVDVEEQDDGCGMTTRWRDGNTPKAYLVMQAIPNYSTCAAQPDHWMDLYPDTPADPPVTDSYTLVAQSWHPYDLAGKQTALDQWGRDVLKMAGLHPDLEIIELFNDFAAQDNIELAEGWAGAGQYFLDVLAANGKGYQDLMAKALSSGEVIMVGAGNIAVCGSSGTQATADLLGQIQGTIFTAGNNAYDRGTFQEFAQCFDPTWGQYKSRIYPAVGDNDYLTGGATPYFQYFGERAGDPSKGYYSFDAGSWHVVVLNSVCRSAGGCGLDSPQVAWLKDDLDSHTSQCTLAIWQSPLYSSGQIGGTKSVLPFWTVLYDAGADVVVNGLDRDYERFAPMDPFGTLDQDKGIREFVVGTGGGGVRPMNSPQPNSEYTIAYTYGVLELKLKKGSYSWEFVPQAGMGATDSGDGECH